MYAISGKELAWRSVPDPEARPGEVVVRVAATAINRADLMQRAGHYPPPADASPYLGLECSGVIETVGPGVDSHRVGEEVCALLTGGGYAERVAVPAGQLLPIPAGVTLQNAAALPEAAATTWSMLMDLGRLRAGQTLLVHGAAGGIGTFAVQLGHALGATVIATARTDHHARLRELGANRVIDYRNEDFTDANADVILDVVGGPYLLRNIAALAVGGHLLVIGMQGGAKAELDLGFLLSKRASVSAAALRTRDVQDRARVVAGVLRDIWPLIEKGAIQPVVETSLPLDQADSGHAHIAAGGHLGKVILTVP
jgi:putative PIG3 family NAD(P)H quinone oxidoreductase